MPKPLTNQQTESYLKTLREHGYGETLAWVDNLTEQQLEVMMWMLNIKRSGVSLK